jgi:hypothetical protein
MNQPVSFAPPGQGTPAPCTTCGAPMAVTQPPALHQNPELWCRHCGHREGLPQDAADLHRHLRLRLLQLSRARAGAEAPLQTFKAMNGIWPMAIAFSALIGAFQSWNFVSSWHALGKLDPSQAVFGAAPLAVSFGLLCGWLGMRHTFAQQLTPLLRARPPQHAGLAARCRNCGGDLPLVRAPEVTCSFCSATNLLDAALTVNAAALLARETEDYERRLRPWARDPNVYLAPSRAFYRYGAAGGAVALLGLSIITLLLLSS